MNNMGLHEKKIIGFDGWSGGIRHYARFVNDDSYPFVGFKLIHLGSWGAQTDVPEYENIDGVDAYDISYYDTSDFVEILKRETPDCVVFLSTHVFDHRAMLKACRLLAIPTVHIFPGVLGVLAIKSKSIYKFKLLSHLKNIISRLPKLLFYTFKNYVTILARTKSGVSDWVDFAQDLICGALRINQTKHSKGSTADLCLVYLESEREIAVQKYGYEKHNVAIIGLPDVTDFKLSESDILSNLDCIKEGGEALYFDTGYIYTGDLFASVEEYVEHILEVRDYLKGMGFGLIFKPKPQKLNPLKDELLRLLGDNGVVVYEGRDVITVAKKCSFVFSEPSTVALVTALLGMPIFLVGFGKFLGQEYGDCITSYPKAHVLEDLAEITCCLDQTIEVDQIKTWLSHTFSGNAIKNVPQIINQQISNLLLKND